MKKFLNIFTIISLITSGVSSVDACSNSDKSLVNYPVTKQQEENALVNFAQKHGIQENNINKSNWSFQNHTVTDKKETISFSFEELNNVKNMQLLKEFKGEMIYNLENRTFGLTGEPFDNPILIPGYYKSSTDFSSTITGNASDFTIAAGCDDLDRFADDLTTGDTQTLPKLFSSMHWKNIANFEDKSGKPLLKVPELEKLQKNYPQAWQLPNENYMALIHVIKTHGVYHIAWSNLDSDQDKESLAEKGGGISSVFWKDINAKGVQYHLWCNQELVKELAQIYALYHSNPDKNPWFQNDNLNEWLINKSDLGVQTIKTTSSDYNTSIEMLDQSLQYLNNNNFASWVQNHNYKNYDLVFNKDFSFNAKYSQELN